MSRTVCPVCRQHHRTQTPRRDRIIFHVAVSTARVALAVLVILVLVAVFG